MFLWFLPKAVWRLRRWLKPPEKIVREAVTPGLVCRFPRRRLAKSLGLEGKQARQAAGMFQKLYTLYREMDASIVEINPLVVTEQGALVALDAKMNFDGNALHAL